MTRSPTAWSAWSAWSARSAWSVWASVGAALVAAVVAWRLDAPRLARLLADDAPAYAVAIGWVCVAPVVLAFAALVLARTPWPWVVALALHLVVLTAATARLRHLVPGVVWGGVALSVVLGVASVVAATAAHEERRSR